MYVWTCTEAELPRLSSVAYVCLVLKASEKCSTVKADPAGRVSLTNPLDRETGSDVCLHSGNSSHWQSVPFQTGTHLPPMQDPGVHCTSRGGQPVDIPYWRTGLAKSMIRPSIVRLARQPRKRALATVETRGMCDSTPPK